jgi:hypothetical protein
MATPKPKFNAPIFRCAPEWRHVDRLAFPTFETIVRSRHIFSLRGRRFISNTFGSQHQRKRGKKRGNRPDTHWIVQVLVRVFSRNVAVTPRAKRLSFEFHVAFEQFHYPNRDDNGAAYYPPVRQAHSKLLGCNVHDG